MRSFFATVRLHEGATRESLAALRILVFGIWTVLVLTDPIQQLVFLPIDLFHPYGIFRLIPMTVWAAVITPTGLLGLKLVSLALFAWSGIGFRGARGAAIAAFAVGFFYLEVKKGFGGHWDHRELTLAYITGVLALTPAWDALAARRLKVPAPTRRPDIYRASLLAICLVNILQYLYIGAARLFIGAPGVFEHGTLQNWILNRNLRPNPFGFDIGTYFLAPFWAVPLDLLFLGGTLLEIAAVILLFLKPGWFKVVFLFGFFVFHLSIFLLMNVAFPEDAVLLLAFFDLAYPLRRIRAGHENPGTVLFDPASAKAVDIVRRAYAHDRDHLLTFIAKGSSEAALVLPTAAAGSDLVFIDSVTHVVVTGRAAHNEVRYRRPGRSIVARLALNRSSGLSLPPRSRFGSWFLGPAENSTQWAPLPVDAERIKY